MKKVFIAQHFEDRERTEVLAERILASKKAEQLYGVGNFTIISSFFEGDMTGTENKLSDFSKQLEIMSEADVVLFMPYWKEFPTTKIMHMCAKEFGKKAQLVKM